MKKVKKREYRNDEFCRHDFLIHDLDVLGIKGRKSGEHFVHESTKRPPINRFAVAVALEHFGRQILGRAAKGRCPIICRRQPYKREKGVRFS